VNSQPLHPNLARIAAAYDRIIDQMEAHQLSVPAAREQIRELEARDDAGVRWSIDPDTGQFMRKTVFGGLEFDTPPTSGVMTFDAFSFSPQSRDDDPSLRVTYTPVDTPSTAQPQPSSRTRAGVVALRVAAAALALAAAWYAWHALTPSTGHDHTRALAALAQPR